MVLTKTEFLLMVDSVKTFNGIAVASIKTYQGIAKASVKTVNGIALPVTDPYFASVVLLAGNENGTDGGTTFIDQSSYARTMTRNGNTQWDTAQFPTGMTSSVLCDGVGDNLTGANGAELDLSNNSMTLEGMIRPANTTQTASLFEKRASGAAFAYIAIIQIGTALTWFCTSNGLTWNIASALNIGTVAANTWYHWAVVRNGTSFVPYLAGVAGAGTATSAAAITYDTSSIFMGTDAGGAIGFSGWFSNVRLTNGVARYTANFTPPTLPLPTS